MILSYALILAMGIVLGLLGGGGSILTVPILVYGFQVEAEKATLFSLIVVGVIASIASLRHAKNNSISYKNFLFLIPAFLGTFFSRRYLLPSLAPQMNFFGVPIEKSSFILITFSLVMIFAGWKMLRSSTLTIKEGSQQNITLLMIIAFSIGLITGFVGAGGGFLIVPVLHYFFKLEMKRAIASSLFIIFINSTLGFLIDPQKLTSEDWKIVIGIIGVASIGIILGTEIGKLANGAQLKRGFAYFVLLLASYMLWQNFKLIVI